LRGIDFLLKSLMIFLTNPHCGEYVVEYTYVQV